MFRRQCVLKAPAQKLLKGVSPVDVTKRVKEEQKKWKTRGEKERVGLKGL